MSFLRCSSLAVHLRGRVSNQCLPVTTNLTILYSHFSGLDIIKQKYIDNPLRHYSNRRSHDLLSTEESEDSHDANFTTTRQSKPSKMSEFHSRNSYMQIRKHLREKYNLGAATISESQTLASESKLDSELAEPQEIFGDFVDNELAPQISDAEKLRQTRFIKELKERNIGKQRLNVQKKEAVVDVSFGYMRFDNMNRRGGAAIDTRVLSGAHLGAQQRNSGSIVEDNATIIAKSKRPIVDENATDNIKSHQLVDRQNLDLNFNSKSKKARDSVTYDSGSKFPEKFLADLEPENTLTEKAEENYRDAYVPQMNNDQLRANKLKSARETDNDSTLFDEQYFGSHIGSNSNNVRSSTTISSPQKKNDVEFRDHNLANIHEAESKSEPLNLFDEQYFSSSDTRPFQLDFNSVDGLAHTVNQMGAGTRLESVFVNEKSNVIQTNEFRNTDLKSDEGQPNLFDEQYFEGLTSKSSDKISADAQLVKKSSQHMDLSQPHRQQKLLADKNKRSTTAKNENVETLRSDFELQSSGENLSGFLNQNTLPKHSLDFFRGTSSSEEGMRERGGEMEIHEAKEAAWEKYCRMRPQANVKNPSTGYDLAMKLRLQKSGKLVEESDERDNLSSSAAREVGDGSKVMPRQSKWTGRLDSKGFRVLEEQVVDVQNMTQDDLVTILRNSVVYEDDNLLVIDKPYGLPSHGGPGVHHSVGKILEPLADRLDRTRRKLDSLHLVHRLDKETTGVMILAKSQQISEMLLTMFKKRQVIKHYWLITKGVPNPTEGVIDIPMGEGVVDGKYRMELRPNHRSISASDDDSLRYRMRSAATTGYETFEAVTNYRVLSSNHSAALVECTPETGVKHQIRCHMAFGLNTPILGDHKYSHYSKIAPQRLYPEILRRLGVRQAKVRHVPMHLHAKAVVLPEFRDGRNLFLSARLPKHFVQNMNWLQLKVSE